MYYSIYCSTFYGCSVPLPSDKSYSLFLLLECGASSREATPPRQLPGIAEHNGSLYWRWWQKTSNSGWHRPARLGQILSQPSSISISEYHCILQWWLHVPMHFVEICNCSPTILYTYLTTRFQVPKAHPEAIYGSMTWTTSCCTRAMQQKGQSRGSLHAVLFNSRQWMAYSMQCME